MKEWPPNQFWLNKIKDEGVRLMVEVDLSFEQFRKLLQDFQGCELNDAEVYHFWKIVDRRLLPTDQGSYSGIGHDVGVLLRDSLDDEPQQEINPDEPRQTDRGVPPSGETEV